MTDRESRSDAGSAMTANSAPIVPPREWKFTQWFKKMPTPGMQPDADVLSAVQFDPSGTHLATGDRGGRIVVLEADHAVGKLKPGGIHYKFHVEFQSHEAEFDYVRSMAIEERITKIRYLAPTSDALFLLSTNDRAIKLWKISRRASESVIRTNIDQDSGRGPVSKADLVLPEVEQVGESAVVAKLRRGFAVDVHQFHINSLAVNSDGETFMSADNLRINVWSAAVADKAFNVIDTKPANMQDLTEVITTLDMHKQSCSQFLYGTSKGVIRLGDLRDRAILDNATKVFATPSTGGATNTSGTPTTPGGTAVPEKSFFSDVTLSISDAKFSPDGNQIIARDFMTVKIYDVRMERQPIETISVHEYLRPKLWDLYENDCVYDGFEVGVAADGSVATGSYHNYFHIYDIKNKTDTWAEASKLPLGTYPISPLIWSAQARQAIKKKRPSRTGARSIFGRKTKSKDSDKSSLSGKEGKNDSPTAGGVDPSDPMSVLHSTNLPVLVNPDSLDYTHKVLHTQFHPKINAIAVAAANNLFLYAQTQGPPPTLV